MKKQWNLEQTPIGVGLRHVHYHEALTTPAPLDFIEVHSENFFAKGGATLSVLKDAADIYNVSLHGTSLGLGSAAGISEQHLESLAALVENLSPVMVSDHAAFAWGELNGQLHHGGDLLPIPFNQQALQVLTDNVNRVQDRLEQSILIENLSAYIEFEDSHFSETDFLNELVEQTGCRLLVDLNNIAVNEINRGTAHVTRAINQWINEINSGAVGEIHLAGCTPVLSGEIMIDDHSQKVSDMVWRAYKHALWHFGATPTLIEWDTSLPEWSVLLNEAEKARAIAREVEKRQTGEWYDRAVS